MANRAIKTMTLLLCSIAFASVANTASYAQNFFGFGSQQSTTTQPVPVKPQPAPTANILSPDDFKNAVSSQGQQNLDSLSQQFNSQIKKPAAPVAPATPAPGNTTSPTANASNPAPAATATPPANSAAQPSPPAATPPAPSYSISRPPAATPSVGAPSPAAAPKKNQIYTGFMGIGNTNTNTNGSTNNNSNNNSSNAGGWNIKY